MKNLFKLFTLIFLGITLLSACSSEEEEPQLEAKDALVSKTWTFSKAEGDASADDLALISAIYAQNEMEFKANGELYWTSFLLGEFTDTLTWELAEDNTKLIFDKGTEDEDVWDFYGASASRMSFGVTEGGQKLELVWN